MNGASHSREGDPWVDIIMEEISELEDVYSRQGNPRSNNLDANQIKDDKKSLK